MIDENYLAENSLNNEAIKTKEKQSLFTFAKISNLYLIPFMAPLFWLIINFLRTKYIKDYNKVNIISKQKSNGFFIFKNKIPRDLGSVLVFIVSDFEKIIR